MGSGDLEIKVYYESTLILSTALTIPSTGHTASLPLEHFQPRMDPYKIKCIASHGEKTYEDETEVSYLPPNPYGGSTVKLDRRTGGMKILRKDGWEEMFPFGWYDVSPLLV